MTENFNRDIRTLLFVPGDRADRIPKALRAAVDAVAIDLEDAVAESSKFKARSITVAALEAVTPPLDVAITVRVNSAGSGLLEQDVESLAKVLAVIDAVVLPMVSTPSDVVLLDGALASAESSQGLEVGSTRVIPLIETAQGVLNARELAESSPRIMALTFGPADLSRELGITPTADGTEMLAARSLLVLASAAAGLPRPIDGPYLDLDDEAGLRTSTEAAKALGFGGKQVIHPKQIQTVTGMFQPGDPEIAWAHRVDDAFRKAEAAGVASIRLDDGTFVDYPIARRARALLAEACPARPVTGGRG